MVPQPDPFQLRNWFAEDLRKIAVVSDDEESERLRTVIDYEGGRRLNTPRAVNRALDAIRFAWSALQDERVELSDLVWLSLIKNGNSELYRWIEAYCGTAAAISLGTASVDDTERNQLLESLKSAVPQGTFDDLTYRHYFAEQLPGIDVDFSKDGDDFQIFQKISENERNAAIADRRLKSPDHYLLYFSFSHPKHALSQHNYTSFWNATNQDANSVRDLLLNWSDTIVSGSMSKADVLLERIVNLEYPDLTDQGVENILLGFSASMDEAYRRRPFDTFWFNNIWTRAERIVPHALQRLTAARQRSVIKKMFQSGLALGWLTTLLRHEIFAHGRFGTQQQPQEAWLMSDACLDVASKAMIERYQKLNLTALKDLINPISTLFAWQQAGDTEGPKKLAEAAIETDEGLLEFVEIMASTVQSSSKGFFEIIKRENLESFLDYDALLERLSALAASGTASSKVRANKLLTLISDGIEY